MTGDAIFIVADKDTVVVDRFFIQQLCVRKRTDDIPVNPALLHEISVNPMHIRIGRRQGDRLRFPFLFLLLLADNRYPDIRAEQKPDR